ncbi:hypothetical protein BDY19DRAFT_923627 [Irpex rosettiformis]|uniref:Uncharacterized protein n=1 Tax=Irpex rosettiformis TaxID=378272 RepID=A0ACB8UGE4_9APHY|nr:hypothetical protein BDY19DRAFT_923627 [Irpex rosettiformis]
MPLQNTSAMSRRPSLQAPFQPPVVEIYSDSRSHGIHGPNRHIRIAQVTSQGGGAISKSEDGMRCVVAGKDSLRILRISEPGMPHSADHKSSVGRDGYRIDASRNLWTGSGLKIDSASTDVVWGHGNFNTKILTSARNGELIMWDLNKSGPTKYERRVRGHVRSIHKIAYSTVLRDYCITGSADGDIRVWDLRNLTESVMKIRHPAAVRSVIFSPVQWQPRHAITGLDNGHIYRWDLNMGQRGQLDRIPLAHSGPILTLDWTLCGTFQSSSNNRNGGSLGPTQGNNWYSNVKAGLFEDVGGTTPPAGEGEGTGMGWLASGGLDCCVKVWNMSPSRDHGHISREAAYTMHTSFPIRRVAWRPGYDCELAITSYQDLAANTQSNPSFDATTSSLGLISSSPRASFLSQMMSGEEPKSESSTPPNDSNGGHPIEIWDVRRGYVAKWTVRGSAVEGGVTDIAFADSHTLWAQHFSGTFQQLDLRYSTRALDAIPRLAVSWDPTGSLVFVADSPKHWEIPYDDIHPDKRPYVKRKVKTLGSKPYSPTSQTLGILTGQPLTDDLEYFAKLAHAYEYEGRDKVALCARNATVAFDVGKHDAAQTWLLLASLLTDVVPQTTNTPAITLSPLPILNPKLPHSVSAPGSIPTIAQVSGQSDPIKAEHSPAPVNEYTSPGSKSVPGSVATSRRGSQKSRTKSTSSAGTGFLSPLRTTPASSTTPSPHCQTDPLPPLGSSLSTSVVAARHPSPVGLLPTFGSVPPPPQSLRSRLGSSYRKSSFKGSNLSNLAAVGEPRSFSHSGLKHIGEGALDDSDSEPSEGERDLHSSVIDETEVPFDGDDNDGDDYDVEMEIQSFANRSRGSPSGGASYWHSRGSSAQPSPLSRIAVQETWTEDERDEGDSPSPASSTDSETSSGDRELEDLSSSGFLPPHPLSRRQSSSKSRRSSMRSSKKSRSRSSTVASLSVSLPPSAMSSRSKLVRTESQSSIMTVTASHTPTSAYAPDRPHSGERAGTSTPHRDAPVRDMSTSTRGDAVSLKSGSFYNRSRPRSEAYSNEEAFELGGGNSLIGRDPTSTGTTVSSNVAREAIRQAEARLRDAGWEAMKESLEILADEGDIQMCAMLALIASDELKIGKGRMVRFIETYIDSLMRLRLHGPAAYIRKHSSSEAVRVKTETGTTIETVCGKCRKPLLQSAPVPPKAKKPMGNFAYCLKCKAGATKCSICHLPVRALAFTCPICMHGGHQECYQQYHTRRPLISVTPTVTEPTSLPYLNPNNSNGSQRSQRPPLGPRASSVGREDREGSDDGISTREGDGSLVGSKITETMGDPSVSNVAIQGHPCAAGCGHYCWATNEPNIYENVLVDAI